MRERGVCGVFRGQFHQHFMGSFYAHRSQKRKKTDYLTDFFVLLGSTHIKATCKILVKLTSGVTHSYLYEKINTRGKKLERWISDVVVAVVVVVVVAAVVVKMHVACCLCW